MTEFGFKLNDYDDDECFPGSFGQSGPSRKEIKQAIAYSLEAEKEEEKPGRKRKKTKEDGDVTGALAERGKKAAKIDGAGKMGEEDGDVTGALAERGKKA